MKNLLLLTLAFSFFLSAKAQLKLGTNPNSINSSALLELESTSKGLLFSRMTAAQRGAISSPATGLLVYQTDGTSGFYYFNGSSWVKLDAGSTPSQWTTSGSDIYYNTGNVGIGVASPSSAFQVNGTVRFQSLSSGILKADASGNISSSALSASEIPDLDAAKITTGTLPVSRGGTGVGTLAANAVLIGNGTSAVSTLAPGTSGNVLISNGTNWTSADGSGSFIKNQTSTQSSANFNISGNGTLGSLSGTGNRLVFADVNGQLKTINATTGTNRSIFTNTGSDQTFTVPSGVTVLFVKLWGAGGGGTANVGGGCGGSGGFVSGYLAVTPGESLTVIVGSGGTYGGGTTYGGGGSGASGGSGGGRSALRRGSTELVTAGGGGGGARGSWTYCGGNGGGVIAGNGVGGNAGLGGGDTGGRGANSSQNGSQYTGGNANSGKWAGGGGGGYYGGGGGGSGSDGPGGGGSSYTGGLIPYLPITNEPGAMSSGQNLQNHVETRLSSGGWYDVDYADPVGRCGAGGSISSSNNNGGNGRVVIYW